MAKDAPGGGSAVMVAPIPMVNGIPQPSLPTPLKGDRLDTIPQQCCNAPWGALKNGRGG